MDWTVSILLTEDELLVVNNCLNEVCNGFYLDAFESKIGASIEEATHILDGIGLMASRNRAEYVVLLVREWRVVLHAIKETCRELGDFSSEIETRVGMPEAFIQQTAEKIEKVLQNA